jgi:hypothetical protein
MMLLFKLSPEIKNKFEREYAENRSKSNKRQRVYAELDDGKSFKLCF